MCLTAFFQKTKNMKRTKKRTDCVEQEKKTLECGCETGDEEMQSLLLLSTCRSLSMVEWEMAEMRHMPLMDITNLSKE